ncbi:hypothetical protein [Zhongshania sp. BJYM1]|uniref:hypothetical protein n=1 Tax=Zhongshania aquatica TaxID=2965069 RepID=UPI003313006F
MIAETTAGGTCVNHIAAHVLDQNLLFGGVNNSGIGSYHREWGIRAFAHERAIARSHYMTTKHFSALHTAYPQDIRANFEIHIRLVMTQKAG